ncbi:MAG: tetratricopeptide repeat protein [Romboutsia sp.]
MGIEEQKSINNELEVSTHLNEEKYVELLCQGVDLKRMGSYEEAKSKYIEAIRMDSKKPNGYYNLGKILYILGEYESSARALKTSFELGVDPYNVLIHLGHALNDKEAKNGEWKDVVKDYERGVNPFLIKKAFEEGNFEITNPSRDKLQKYEELCIKISREYLGLDGE